MISYGYWQRRFGGDRSVIGRTITMDARPREIVGVMPQGFTIVNTDADVICRRRSIGEDSRSAGSSYQGVARLSRESRSPRPTPTWRE
jgi:hypothetical protein